MVAVTEPVFNASLDAVAALVRSVWLLAGSVPVATFTVETPVPAATAGELILQIDNSPQVAAATGTITSVQFRTQGGLTLLGTGTVSLLGEGGDLELNRLDAVQGRQISVPSVRFRQRATRTHVGNARHRIGTHNASGVLDFEDPTVSDGVSRLPGAPLTMVTGVQSTLTASFHGDVFFGQYVDGSWWIAASDGNPTESVFLRAVGGGQGGSDSAVSNGVMKNPLPLVDDSSSLRSQGWDSNLGRTSATFSSFQYHYDPPENIATGLDGSLANAVELIPGDCIVLSDTFNPPGNGFGLAQARYFEVIHVVAIPRDRRQTLRPGPWGLNPGGQRLERDLANAKFPGDVGSGSQLLPLGDLSDFTISAGAAGNATQTISPVRPTIPATGPGSWSQPLLHYVASFIGDTCSGAQHVSIETQMANTGGTLALACVDSSRTEADRRDLWIRLLQCGVDIESSVSRGDMIFPVNGGSNSGWKFFVVALRWAFDLPAQVDAVKGYALANSGATILPGSNFREWSTGNGFSRSVPIWYEDFQSTRLSYNACLADDTNGDGTIAHGYLPDQDGMPQFFSFSALNFPDGVVPTIPDSGTVASIIAKGAPNKNLRDNDSQQAEYLYSLAVARGQTLALRALGTDAVDIWNATLPADFEFARGSWLDVVDRFRRVIDDNHLDANGDSWNQFFGSGLRERSNRDVLFGEHHHAMAAWLQHRASLQDAYWGPYGDKAAFQAFANGTHGEPTVTALSPT